jgi:predicted DNA-binding transcriptional regulator AlpA
MELVRLVGWDYLREHGIRWSRQYILELEKKKKFPRRVRLGPNSIAWCEEEIQAFLQERSDARTGQPSRWAVELGAEP